MASVYKSLSRTPNGQPPADHSSSGSSSPSPPPEAAATTASPIPQNDSSKTISPTTHPSPYPRHRLLILPSRGITHRHRHLLTDLHALLPHSRRDAKLDTKSRLGTLNEVAELYNCDRIMFFEARKGKDLYVWMAAAPNGPCVKFGGVNVHTMEELHFTGNCLKGSRPVLSFDKQFESAPHLRLIKELFTQVFGVPKGARKTKPFVDHVMGFTIADGKIWVRVYQIGETEEGTAKPTQSTETGKDVKPAVAKKSGETKLGLVEIGPRFVLTPIVILEGSFGGPVIYENKEYVSPNQIRSDLRLRKAGRYAQRSEAGVERKAKRGDLGLRSHGGRRKVKSALDESVLFA
ncbi:MAG: Ribosome biogenesis protein brx1 [Piccolia ochrophora]|nr:MAG: Ribosome biogenesis protein brx1 [Piccolia ochrophora]